MAENESPAPVKVARFIGENVVLRHPTANSYVSFAYGTELPLTDPIVAAHPDFFEIIPVRKRQATHTDSVELTRRNPGEKRDTPRRGA